MTGPVQSWQTESEGNNFTWQLCSARTVLCGGEKAEQGGQCRACGARSGEQYSMQRVLMVLSAPCSAIDVTSGGVTPLLCRIPGR